MKEDCIYCDRLFEERDLITCQDCNALGCSTCIGERHCCNGLPEDEDSDFYEKDEEQEED